MISTRADTSSDNVSTYSQSLRQKRRTELDVNTNSVNTTNNKNNSFEIKSIGEANNIFTPKAANFKIDDDTPKRITQQPKWKNQRLKDKEQEENEEGIKGEAVIKTKKSC